MERTKNTVVESRLIEFQCDDIQSDKMMEIIKWLQENVSYHYQIRIGWSFGSDSYSGQIVFPIHGTGKEDAMAFKLRWI